MSMEPETCKMETMIVEESDIMQISPGKVFQSVVGMDNFSDDTAQVAEQERHEAPAMDGNSHSSEKVTEVEQKLELAQQRIEELERKLIQVNDNACMHCKDREVQLVLFEEKLCEVEKEREDALAQRDRLNIFKLEATRLANELKNSELKILQLELNAKVTIEKLDETTKNVHLLREKDAALQEKLAAAELKTKVAEEKFNMQTEILQEETKLRALMGNELNDTGAEFDKKEINLTQLIEKLIELEGHLKSSAKKTREYEKLAEQNEENVLNETERARELEKLSALSKLRENKMEQIATAFQEELQGLHEKYSLSKNKTEAKLLKVEEELKHSQEQVYELEKKLSLAEVVMDTQDPLAASELDFKSSAPMEIEVQANMKDFGKQLTRQESFVKQTTAKYMELDLPLESQAKGMEMKCLEVKEAYMHADSEVERLSEKLKPLEIKESEGQAAQASASVSASAVPSQNLQIKGMAQRISHIGRILLPSSFKISGMTERMAEDQDVPSCETKTTCITNCTKLFNIGFQIVQGVTLVLIWAIFWKMFFES